MYLSMYAYHIIVLFSYKVCSELLRRRSCKFNWYLVFSLLRICSVKFKIARTLLRRHLLSSNLCLNHVDMFRLYFAKK